MPDRVEEGVDRHDRTGEWQDDVAQEAEIARAVDPGRIEQLTRNGGLEVRAGDDDIPDRKGRGQNERPTRVEQPKIAHDEVGRDEPAAEQRGEKEEEHDPAAAAQIGARERIGRQQRQHDIHRGAGDGVEDRVEKAAHDRRILEDRLVGDRGRLDRPELDPPRGHRRRTAEGGADEVEQWVEHDHQVDGQEDVVEAVEDAVAAGVFDRARCQCRLPGSTERRARC